MSTAYQIVVCAGIVPDPLQTLEPVAGATGPALKNEMMMSAVLSTWDLLRFSHSTDGGVPLKLQP